jgi:EmrB/QacA subfamily drug resistance transporter
LSARALTLAATVLGSSLAFLDATVVVVALPTMERDLALGLDGQQWIVLSYSLALAALYLPAGALGDRYGRRAVFVVGVVAFAAASALAGAAPNAELLIAARALQGVGGALMTTNSLALLRATYGDEAGRAVGLWTALTTVSTVAGPPAGGALVEWASWRWIFYLNLPLAGVTIVLARLGRCKELEEQRIGRLDVVGAALAAAGFALLTYGLVEQVWWTLAPAAVALAAFAWAERHVPEPLLPFDLFRRRNFAVANLETFFVYAALGGQFLYVTIFLQFLGFSPFEAGLIGIPTSLVLIALGARFGALADRHGPRPYLVGGAALIGAGTLLLLPVDDIDSFWMIGFPGTLVFALGLAMIVAPITSTALKSAPSRYSGIAAGVNSMVSRVGGLLAVALVGLVVTLVFGHDGAVPLARGQSDPQLRADSIDAFRAGLLVVAALAFAGAATALAISNREALSRDETPAPQPAPARG